MSKKYQIICNIPFPKRENIPYPFLTFTAIASDFEEAKEIIGRFQRQYGNIDALICDSTALVGTQSTTNIAFVESNDDDAYASSKQIGCLYYALLDIGEDLTEWCVKNGFPDQYHIPRELHGIRYRN